LSEDILVVLISTAGAVVVGLGSVAVNAYWIGKHLDSLERRLGVIEQDLKQFYRDILHIKQKIGLE
jgi:hypothetical protein